MTTKRKVVNFKKEDKSKKGGLTAKGRAKYNKATGGNLKAPVTGKVKPGSKAAKRRKSFCSRMKGMKKKYTAYSVEEPEPALGISSETTIFIPMY